MLVCQPDLESLIRKASFSTCDSGSCQLAEAPWNIFSNHNTREKGKGCVYLFVMITCMHAKLLESCLTLCDPMDYSPRGSSVYGILQARILNWVVCPPPEYLPDPRIPNLHLVSPALAGRFFTPSATWEILS